MKPAVIRASQTHANPMKNGRIAPSIALIVASAFVLSGRPSLAAEPPPQLLTRIAQREAENGNARKDYLYRQLVTIQELNSAGVVTGQYHEASDITFSANRVRNEQVVDAATNTLTRIKLTPEDFSDLRNVQPFLLTPDQVPLYEGQFKGEETMDGYPCFVEYIRPRQILAGQRFFEGTLWVRQSDFSVVRSEGQAVPQIETLTEQNLFPHFTTIRREIDGKWFFPVRTYADDTLYFRQEPERIRIDIRYENYRRFGAESTITYGTGNQPPPSQPPPAPSQPTQPKK
jgi:hypothetical protein